MSRPERAPRWQPLQILTSESLIVENLCSPYKLTYSGLLRVNGSYWSTFSPMPANRTFSATFQIVTPLFLGGVNREAEGFRIASLKGALRFWWRAVEYPAHVARAGGDRQRALAELRRAEIHLFGSTEAQSRVLMRLETGLTALRRQHCNNVLCGVGGRRVDPGARYLGYGLMRTFGESAGELTRSCLLPGPNVTVHFHLKPEADVESFLRALKLFGLVGGLGSRARRGWGSLALIALDGEGYSWQPPQTKEAYRSALLMVLGDVSIGEAEPPFTAFGPETRIDLLNSGADAFTVLNQMGKAMQRYRSWGHKGVVNGQPSEKNFETDHDWSKAPFAPSRHGDVPRRIIFGLPHNYGKELGIVPVGDGSDRRASPLLLHVHRLGANSYIGVSLLLRSQFLPTDHNNVMIKQGKNDSKLGSKSTLRNKNTIRSARVDWTVLTDFLDGPEPTDRDSRKPYFPDRIPVLPDRR
jgi:CRISPR-associated protein Cmr1